MNRINPRKLLNSKWTAVNPVQKEKHFQVSDLVLDENGGVVSCTLEALISRRSMLINWHDLQDESRWVFGWK